MKYKLLGVFIMLALINSALINNAMAGNISPATAVIQNTNDDNKIGCGDTLTLSFHTSSPWTIKLNGTPIMSGLGPSDTIAETNPHENTYITFPLNSPEFCSNQTANLKLNSSVPQDGYSELEVKYPKPTYNKGYNYTLSSYAWHHNGLQEPNVGDIPPVPEASTIVLFALGIIGIIGISKKEK